jgi:hypothetical protein
MGDEGVLLSDALLAALGYDGFRSSLESLLVATSKFVENEQLWVADLDTLAKDGTVVHQVKALIAAAKRFQSSPEIEATQELRARLKEHTPATIAGAMELLCSQHAAICRQRGIGLWVQIQKGRLEFARRTTGAMGTGLARYRLGSLVSLIRDLQWTVKG